MKKLLLIVLLAFTAVGTGYAQKKNSGTETQINVNYPVLSVIYTDGEDAEGLPLGMADLQIHDRQGQTNDLDYHRLVTLSRSGDPVSPYIKVVFMEELGGYNFRITENMEERARAVDGIKTLLIHRTALQPAMRVKFPN